MIAKGGITMQDYNTIIGSIQMRLNGCQTRSVMDRYKIGSGTLSLIMSRYHANGIPIEELRMMAPKEVEELFYPQKNLQRKDIPLPDFQYYYDRIHTPGSRMNISFCWLDYKEKNPDGYEKSQFYEYFNRFIAENCGGQKVSMAVNRIPGEKMYIDWVGDQPELLTDIETGEMKKLHIFATTLGVSSLIYAEAFPNEKLPCFIEGCTHAVSFYGAVTKYFVTDNLRTAVTKHTKDELILQSTFADLEDFYETIVLPPPARKPKGKPTVENHVRYLETHLIEKLKEKIYVSLEDLNADIKKIVAVLNKRSFQGKDFSRLDAFEKYDKPCMKPLPGGISLGMVSTHRLASWEFHCFSSASAAFHKVLRSAYSGGALPDAGFHCGRYLAFPGSASLAGHIHRTVFRHSDKQRRQPQTAAGCAAQ